MRMTISSRARVTTLSGGNRGTAVLGGVLLVGGLIFLLWLRFGFARYAFTAFLWKHTNGTVMNSRLTTDPTIQFTSVDGSPHAFSEDYFLLCGHRSLCYRRSFSPGEVVSIVYDPGAPERAYVYDFALFTTIAEWCFEAGLLLLFLFVLMLLLRGRSSSSMSIRIDTNPDPE
jgi:hypothetical protein